MHQVKLKEKKKEAETINYVNVTFYCQAGTQYTCCSIKARQPREGESYL